MTSFITLKMPQPLRESLLLPMLMISVLVTSIPVFAGDEEWTEEHIMREISYLAKTLLDKSGEESITVESPRFMKPFIGVCSDISDQGVKLTCVTPGTQAAKAGLQTGDIVVKMRGLDLVNKDQSLTKTRYYDVVGSMKTGDKIDMTLMRNGEQQVLTVTVGSLSHPAYVLEVNR